MTESTESEKHTIDLRQFPGVMENLPCCFYIAEGKEPYRLLYANEQTIRLLDCRDVEDLYRHTEGRAFHFIAMEIGGIHLAKKTGGKSGSFVNDPEFEVAQDD